MFLIGFYPDVSMKEKFIGCMLAVVMLTACNSRKADSDAYLAEDVLADSLSDEDSLEEDELSDEAVDEELQLPSNADMLFDDFVFVFIQSRKVQLERVRFPFPEICGKDTTWIPRERWRHKTLYLNSDEYTVFYNNSEQMEEEKSTALNHVDVEHLLVKEKLLDTYHFERIKGKWWMVEKTRQPLSDSPLAGFLNFYYRFATDSVYRYDHITDPLEYVAPDPEDEFEMIKGTIDKVQWQAFGPVLPYRHLTNIRYGQTYSNPNRMVVVMRGTANGMMDILTFHRQNGEWKLVSYES